jgi:protein-disulfide isomerase
MKTMILLASASLLMLSACNKAEPGNSSAPAPSTTPVVAVPAGTNWTETFTKTPAGGMMMGNPDAPVKLVEYGALTCSHCAEFAEKSGPTLKAMIAKGSVSYEFRNYMLNILDVPAALLARCSGPGPFFPITEQLFATQSTWLGKASSVTKEEQASWAKYTPEQVAPLLAAKLGLIEFVQARGIGSDKAKACLSSKAEIDVLGKISERASNEYKITGTPTFLINGLKVPDTSTWEVLEPQLKKAGA